jgi:hypothetical protein
MKKQGNMTSSKFNTSMVTALMIRSVDEILKNFFKKIIIMVSEIKKDINKCLNEFQENSKN